VLQFDEWNLPPGIHWIKGENGSGKSTLFKSIAGILPHEGTITLQNGPDQQQDPIAFRRAVSFAEAEPQFPGFLTAHDIIRFTGYAKGATIAQQDEVSARFGVNHFERHPCETYSSGMLKKLSLALAFIGDSRVIILDEPLITIDEAARKALWSMVAELLSRDIIFLISSYQLLENSTLPIRSTFKIENKTLLPA